MHTKLRRFRESGSELCDELADLIGNNLIESGDGCEGSQRAYLLKLTKKLKSGFNGTEKRDLK